MSVHSTIERHMNSHDGSNRNYRFKIQVDKLDALIDTTVDFNQPNTERITRLNKYIN